MGNKIFFSKSWNLERKLLWIWALDQHSMASLNLLWRLLSEGNALMPWLNTVKERCANSESETLISKMWPISTSGWDYHLNKCFNSMIDHLEKKRGRKKSYIKLFWRWNLFLSLWQSVDFKVSMMLHFGVLNDTINIH